MPENQKLPIDEIREFLKHCKPIVPFEDSKDSLNLGGLSCDDFLMIISLAEFSNIDLSKYWKYHDENCDCELSLKNIELLT